jgi:hypothetical protein
MSMAEGAMARLIREYLAEASPGRDPEQHTDAELVKLLGSDRFLPWLDRHPDQALVPPYWEEDDRECNKAVAEWAIASPPPPAK